MNEINKYRKVKNPYSIQDSLVHLREAARINGFEKKADLLFLNKDIEGLRKLSQRKGYWVRLPEGDEGDNAVGYVMAICKRCFDKKADQCSYKSLESFPETKINLYEGDDMGDKDSCMFCGVDVLISDYICKVCGDGFNESDRPTNRTDLCSPECIHTALIEHLKGNERSLNILRKRLEEELKKDSIATCLLADCFYSSLDDDILKQL